MGGEVRAVPQLERRLKEAAKLGFEWAIIPEAQRLEPKECPIRTTAVATVGDVMRKGLLPRRQEKRAPASLPAGEVFARLGEEQEPVEL